MKMTLRFLSVPLWLGLSVLSAPFFLVGLMFGKMGGVFRKVSYRLGVMANTAELWSEGETGNEW